MRSKFSCCFRCTGRMLMSLSASLMLAVRMVNTAYTSSKRGRKSTNSFPCASLYFSSRSSINRTIACAVRQVSE
uniref:Putative secreted protein n=1 Tax=Anopheles darlingi TaxID=43151 RepID=A0A2M4DJQ6_ANODA